MAGVGVVGGPTLRRVQDLGVADPGGLALVAVQPRGSDLATSIRRGDEVDGEVVVVPVELEIEVHARVDGPATTHAGGTPQRLCLVLWNE